MNINYEQKDIQNLQIEKKARIYRLLCIILKFNVVFKIRELKKRKKY